MKPGMTLLFFIFFLFSSPLSYTCSHPHHLSLFFLPSGLVPHSPFFLSVISGPHRWISFCFHQLVGPLVVFLSIDVPTDVGFIGGHRWWLEKCGARKHGKKWSISRAHLRDSIESLQMGNSDFTDVPSVCDGTCFFPFLLRWITESVNGSQTAVRDDCVCLDFLFFF